MEVFRGSYPSAPALPPHPPRQSDKSYLEGCPLLKHVAALLSASDPFPQIMIFIFWEFVPRVCRRNSVRSGCPRPWMIRRREIVCHV